MAWWRRIATVLKSWGERLLDVSAAVPMRIPPGESADMSPGTEFLLSDILTRSHRASTLLPVIQRGLRSMRMRWLSVPPVASLYPRSRSDLARVLALITTCLPY